jgi:hypothetical protein
MKRTILISAIILSAIVATAMAQPRGAVDFQLLKINTNFISSPQFTYTGAEQFQADQRERWLEVEVTFACAPEFTDELTLKFHLVQWQIADWRGYAREHSSRPRKPLCRVCNSQDIAAPDAWPDHYK